MKHYPFCTRMLSYLLSLFFLLLIHLSVLSQAGNMDSSFNGSGMLPGSYYAFTVQPDGKILIASNYFDQAQNNAFIQLSRLKENGSADSSFGENGYILIDFDVNRAIIKTCPDGKIVVLGVSSDSFNLFRFYPDGKPDYSFGHDGKSPMGFLTSHVTVNDMEVQPNGKLVLAGSKKYGLSNYDESFFITRINLDGSIDTHFGDEGIVTAIFNSQVSNPDNGMVYNDIAVIKEIRLQPDGKIVAVGGVAVWLNGYSSDSIAVARYNSDGTLDSNFAKYGKLTLDPSTPYNQNISGYGAYGHSAVIQPDGKIVIGASCYYSQSHGVWFYSNLAVLRLTGNGTLDNTFDQDGMMFMDLAPYGNYIKLGLQSDHKILVCTTTGTGRDAELSTIFQMSRVLGDGSPDNGFGFSFPQDDGTGHDHVYAMEMFADRICVNGITHTTSALFAFKYDGICLNPLQVSFCSTVNEGVIIADVQGAAYQWQLSTDSVHFFNIADGTNYSGVNTASLTLHNFSLLSNGHEFRCMVDNTISNITSIHLLTDSDAVWIGAVSNDWEDAANWLCNQIPGSDADVIINGGNVSIHSNVIIHSLHVNPGASVKVSAGYILAVLNNGNN